METKQENKEHEYAYHTIGLVGSSSLCIVLPKRFALDLGLNKGDYVKVLNEQGKIVIEKANSQVTRLRDGKEKDFESNIENIRRLYFDAINSKPFWSGAKKIVFADDWIRSILILLSVGTSLHGLKHRVVLDEDDEVQEIPK